MKQKANETDAREMINSFASAIRAAPLRGLGRNCYELSSSPLYIKAGTSFFWGLTKNRLEAIERLGHYFVVFLVSPDEGWVFSSREVNRRIADEVWKLAGDGDYKVNGPLPDVSRFTAHKQFLEIIDRFS